MDKYQSALSHLSQPEIDEIIQLYYDSDIPIKEIIKTYNITEIQPYDLYKCFSPIICENLLCPYCGRDLLTKRTSRSDSKYKRTDTEYCPECNHVNSSNCSCLKCSEKKKALEAIEAERKLNFLRGKLHLSNPFQISYDELSLKQKTYLGTFLRAGISDDFDYIKSFDSSPNNIFPTDDFLNIAFHELFDNYIILIHPQSTVNCFTPNYEKNTYTFSWKDVQYYANIKSEDGYDHSITELLNPPVWEEIYSDQMLELWNEIIYWECIELFNYRMNSYGFEFSIGKETKGLFEDLIKTLSISQIYSIIWNGAKNAAAYYQEGKVPKRQAANSVVSRMRNSADKIISGQWRNSDYTRPKECPQSIVSQYFFNSVLKICDQGWNTKPYKISKETKTEGTII